MTSFLHTLSLQPSTDLYISYFFVGQNNIFNLRFNRKRQRKLLIKLNDLQEKLCSSRNDHNLVNEYITLKTKLEKLSNKKIEGTI